MLILHDVMNISILVMYAQSIMSKTNRISRDVKRGRSNEQGQPRLKKRAPDKKISSSPKGHKQGDGGSPVA